MNPIDTITAANILGVHRSRVIALIRTGRLPATKIGRDWVLDKATVLAFKKIPRPPGYPAGKPRNAP